MFDSGRCNIYSLTNTATAGNTPKFSLSAVSSHNFEDRVVGVSRFEAAMSNKVRIERLIRIWFDAAVTAGQVCKIDSAQYRVYRAQPVLDENGLRVMDLSLERLGDAYEYN